MADDVLGDFSPRSDASTGSSGLGGIGSLFGGLGSIAGGIGSFVAGQDTQSAFEAAAQGYDTAALYAGLNAQLAGQSGTIQEMTKARTIQHFQGAQASAAAANGLEISGSSLSLIRDTAQEGALQEASIGLQTAINITNFQEQEAALKAQAKSALATGAAAAAAGTGSAIGGVLGGIGGIIKAIPIIGSFF